MENYTKETNELILALRELESKVRDKKDELVSKYNKQVTELNKRYSEYTGKLVRLSDVTQHASSAEGYFLGFMDFNERCNYHNFDALDILNFKPRIAMRKQDGSISKKIYMPYNVPSLKETLRIQLI